MKDTNLLISPVKKIGLDDFLKKVTIVNRLKKTPQNEIISMLQSVMV